MGSEMCIRDSLSSILKERPKKKFNTEIFNVMAKRRSTRKFSRNPVEMWKIDKILVIKRGDCCGYDEE